jgi:peptide/nickel transport system permease protein
MMKKLFLNPLFLIGFLFITLLLTASIFHTFVLDGVIRQTQVIYEGINPLESAPLEPSLSILFGTDSLGFHMLDKIILGAKFTITFALIIAGLRVGISLIVGMLYGTYLMRFKPYIDGVVDSFHYIPVSLLAYYMLRPVLWESPDGFLFNFPERVAIEVVVLTLVALPITSVLIGNETGSILKEEFIEGAKTLGGSKLHILKKHVRPHLAPRIAIIFGQQVISVLLIFAHLGLFNLFFGGTEVNYSKVPDPPQSFSGEWSGLIGDSFRTLRAAPWIPLTPIIFFGITILAINFMLEGFKQVVNSRYTKAEQHDGGEFDHEKDGRSTLSKSPFEFRESS